MRAKGENITDYEKDRIVGPQEISKLTYGTEVNKPKPFKPVPRHEVES